MGSSGPIMVLKYKSQKKSRQIVSKLADVAKSEGFDKQMAIYAGRARISELRGGPQACFEAYCAENGLHNKDFRDAAGVQRMWPTLDGQWALYLTEGEKVKRC